MNVNSETLSDVAPTLAVLIKLPMEQKCRLLLARLAKIGEHDSALNKHNLTMLGDPYGLAHGYADAEKTPVREHLLGAPWIRLVNEGYLADLRGQGFYKVTEEGKEYIAQGKLSEPSSSSTKMQQSTTGAPRAFLSYSWDGLDHQQWVTEFAERLQGQSGVEIIFDRWHLKPGDDKLFFMEQAVAKSNFVVVVCTPTYAERANKRQGGVGYESMVITSELAEHMLTNKFIPVLRKGTWNSSLPMYLKTRWGVNLSDEPYREDEYEKLLRALHGEPIQPPALGNKPVFSKNSGPLSKMDSQRARGFSLKAIIQHRPLPIPGGPADGEELYELMVGIENDGDRDATDFRLDVEVPTGFVDGGGYIIEKKAIKPGVRLFQVSHIDRKIEHLYPSTTIDNLVTINCVVPGKIKREHPELLEEKISATVYSASMTPSVTTKTLAELRSHQPTDDAYSTSRPTTQHALSGPATAVRASRVTSDQGFLPVTEEAFSVSLSSGYDRGFLLLIESQADQEFTIVAAAAQWNGLDLGPVNRPPGHGAWVIPSRGRQQIRWPDHILVVSTLVQLKGEYRGTYSEMIDFTFQCGIGDVQKTFRKKIKVQVDPKNRRMTQI